MLVWKSPNNVVNPHSILFEDFQTRAISLTHILSPQMADKLTPYLSQWFREFTQYKLNIAIVDFQDKSQVENLIKLNLPAAAPETAAACIQKVTAM